MTQIGQIHPLKDGLDVEIRPLHEDDYEKSLRFFRDLPEADRTYLRVDVTDPEVVRQRMKGSPLENVFRLIALDGDRIVADGDLRWPDHGWMSHVGEVRVIIAKEYRRRGLASLLYRQLFIQAVKSGMEKLEVLMMPQQISARKCVEKLGFTEEGLLKGFVKDGKGNLQDLLIMSTKVEAF